MLLFPNTKVIVSDPRPVLSGQTVDTEGRALVGSISAGVFGVSYSAGTGSEDFVGVSVDTVQLATSIPLIEDKVSGTSNTFTLSQTPSSSTLRIVDSNTGTVQTVGTPGTTVNQYSISGVTVTVHASLQGHSFRCFYRYSPTVAQAVALFGNTQPGGPAGLYLGLVGVISKGDVFTTEFDTTVDWSAGGTLTLGANGRFTIGGSGNSLAGKATIISIPTVGSPVPALGIQLR